MPFTYLSHKSIICDKLASGVVNNDKKRIGTGMPKSIDEQELADIERHIAAHPEAIGIGKLLSALAADGIVISRRTLLRRLDSLIAAQRIQASGTRKGSRYTKTGSSEGENIQPDSKTLRSHQAGHTGGGTLCHRLDQAARPSR